VVYLYQLFNPRITGNYLYGARFLDEHQALHFGGQKKPIK
jgi:hypothetical protein